jgi:hypothetical protein
VWHVKEKEEEEERLNKKKKKIILVEMKVSVWKRKLT